MKSSQPPFANQIKSYQSSKRVKTKQAGYCFQTSRTNRAPTASLTGAWTLSNNSQICQYYQTWTINTNLCYLIPRYLIVMVPVLTATSQNNLSLENSSCCQIIRINTKLPTGTTTDHQIMFSSRKTRDCGLKWTPKRFLWSTKIKNAERYILMPSLLKEISLMHPRKY